jgi:hypothetical protein
VFGELIRVVRKESIRAEQFATQPVALAIVATFTVAWFMLFPATFGWGAIMTLGAWITMLFLAHLSPEDTKALCRRFTWRKGVKFRTGACHAVREFRAGASTELARHKLLMLIAYSADRVTAGLLGPLAVSRFLTELGIAGGEFVWIRVETYPLSARSR